MEKDTKFLINTIKEAAKLITDDFSVKAKDEKGDLVTNFDFEIEKFIIDRIKQSYEDFDIVSEETNAKKEVTKNCFVIDPIDGTVNFAHGIPLWGIQVAMVKDGKVCASCIYLPKLDECYYADKTGAYKNGERISVKKENFKTQIYIVDGGYRMPTLVRVGNIIRNYRNFGAACISYSFVASGRVAGVIYKWEKCWDYLPGEYLVKQAGGVVDSKFMAHVAACSEEEAKFLSENGKYYDDDMAYTNHDEK